MYWLACSVSDGVFSWERLVKFRDAGGQDYSALVDASLVHVEGARAWLDVMRASDAESNVLVALPTPDGDRVWVHADDVRAAG